MTNTKSWIYANKGFATGLYYIIVILLTFIFGLIDPTNLAGPGLDMLVVFLGIIGSIVLFAISLIKMIKKDRSYLTTLIIH